MVGNVCLARRRMSYDIHDLANRKKSQFSSRAAHLSLLSSLELYTLTLVGDACVALLCTELPADEETTSLDVSNPSGKSLV